jgi:hypothetical protein
MLVFSIRSAEGSHNNLPIINLLFLIEVKPSTVGGGRRIGSVDPERKKRSDRDAVRGSL